MDESQLDQARDAIIELAKRVVRLERIVDQQHDFIAVTNRKIADLEETYAKHVHTYCHHDNDHYEETTSLPRAVRSLDA